ncbi:MAG: hypothetical protein IKH49_00705 [Bacteroidales bacterium]|nr:hypothetical protein [Bacteroidales bacterium]
MGIWHIYSDGTLSDIPFNTDEDKIYAWNSIAICSAIAGVRIWVATINDTHFHSLAEGDEDPAWRYRTVLQQRLQRHFPENDIFLTCDPVSERETILSKFMYVYRNCLDFYKRLPGEYAWGSGNIYFSEKRNFFKGKRIGDLSFREYYRMFRTKFRLPSHWRYDTDVRILPESFIDYEAVEQCFRTVRAFLAFLYVRKEDEAAMKQEIHRNYLESRTIQDLRRLGNKYCSRLCGRSLANAPLDDRLKVAARMLREGLSGKNASFAKALYLQPDDLRLLV